MEAPNNFSDWMDNVVIPHAIAKKQELAEQTHKASILNGVFSVICNNFWNVVILAGGFAVMVFIFNFVSHISAH